MPLIKNKAFRMILMMILSVFIIAGNASGKTEIKNLMVEYMVNPIGIDVERPRLSWQMESDVRGQHQTAYRIFLATDRESLLRSKYLYDTGKINSDESLGIQYNGPVLKPSTRYYWGINAWDYNGNKIESQEEAWFETGLLGSGWDTAKWIGSPETPLDSRYRTNYVIEFDVQIKSGSRKADFIFGARDENNHVKFEIDMDGKGPALMKIFHMTDGVLKKDVEEDISHAVFF